MTSVSKPDTNSSNSSENLEELIMRLKSTSEALHTRLSPSQPPQMTPPARKNWPISKQIDHTLLKADAQAQDVRRVCDEARTHGFATVCLNSRWIPLASQLLSGSTTVPIAVVGFPLGAVSSASKAFETRQAVTDGAREIDMVISLGALKDQDYEEVFRDIQAVVQAAHPYPVKVILETSSLTLEQKVAGCTLSQAAGAAFVKTSTGFTSGGATVEDIALMRRVVGPGMGVKASGGIRTFEDAERMIAAGADRIGASTSVAIVSKQKPAPGGGY